MCEHIARLQQESRGKKESVGFPGYFFMFTWHCHTPLSHLSLLLTFLEMSAAQGGGIPPFILLVVSSWQGVLMASPELGQHVMSTLTPTHS